ncbi:DNA-directed RNA polymerase subunit H [Candidatus Woesearchaeota archaeon]|nr:DNA-directed RNA polymerase subunit H [Candidatus Woesearchaeota archaeon]
MKKKFSLDKHSLIPKHSKLSEKEKKELFEKYSISEKELPKMSKNDAAIQGLGAAPGDIIRITRQSYTAGESFFYRVVTNV